MCSQNFKMHTSTTNSVLCVLAFLDRWSNLKSVQRSDSRKWEMNNKHISCSCVLIDKIGGLYQLIQSYVGVQRLMSFLFWFSIVMKSSSVKLKQIFLISWLKFVLLGHSAGGGWPLDFRATRPSRSTATLSNALLISGCSSRTSLKLSTLRE